MKKNNKKGFTLVELVIVVAVMAVLVAVAIPTVGSITNSAKAAVADSNARTIESVLKLAEANIANTKDAESGSMVATYTLTKDDVTKAITDAKLGIEEGTFYYSTTSGSVTTDEPAEGATDIITITFEASALTVS